MENETRELCVLILRDGLFDVEWQNTNEIISREQAEFQKKFEKYVRTDTDTALLFIGFSRMSGSFSASLNFIKNFADLFAQTILRNPDIEEMRGGFRSEPDKDQLSALCQTAPYMPGWEYIDDQWSLKLWNRFNDAFCGAIKKHKGTVAEFIAHFNADAHIAGHVFFHLVEAKKEEAPFAFLATYSGECTGEGKSKHLPLKQALLEYGKDSKKLLSLLSAVYQAARKSSFVNEILETGEIFHPLSLSAEEAYTILKEVPFYMESGILCRIPDWWKRRSESVKVNIAIGSKAPSMVGIDAILDFDAALSLGGVSVTKKEAEKLLAETEGLLLIKGRWIEVDHQKIKQSLAAYEKAAASMERGLSISEAIRLQLQMSMGKPGSISNESAVVDVSNGVWLESVLSRIKHPEAGEAVDCGDGFHAELRPYQKTGLQWLNQMRMLGFGACLADDMGLGKTIQVISLLNYLKSRNEKTISLLVVPASLISNWMDELRRFAPKLAYYVVHPSENKDADNEGAVQCEKYDLVITTYGLIQKYEWLKKRKWDYIILDEAQAIKNSGTKQARAIKEFSCGNRIVLTGTPIENHLSDLWSLFDFLNPGLLGSAKEFGVFIRELNDHPDGYARLKKIVSPFILRRMKTDRSIITDLPEKIEMKTYADLTKKQAVLYTAFVHDISKKLEKYEGIQRKGLILSSLMKFKQLCNHPDQYLGLHEYDCAESGKFSRLREISEVIYEKRERALVFTQFKELTDPLSSFLETIFNHKGLVLHGETPVAKRKQIVEKFQSDEYIPFLVLSLKAGGVGLNLTKANHVIHFDRWWNPAVENQATDRVFRIGQSKNVIVHKFITKGTIEEKIDALIESKIKSANEIISDSQTEWISEMTNDQVLSLFTLSR